MGKLLKPLLLALTVPVLASPAVTVAAPASGCQAGATTPPKARERKPATQLEKKRPASTLGQGCIGCITPLDGISSAMALRSAY
jgi:hypothetical protein